MPLLVIGGVWIRVGLAIAVGVAVAVAAALLGARYRRTESTRAIDRERLQLELADAEDSFRRLLEGLPLATWQYEAGDRSRTHLVSPQIESMLGFRPEEWGAELLERKLHPEDREILAEVSGAVEAQTPFQVEYRVLDRQGQVVWVREEGATISGPDGAPHRGQSFLLDIGDRKQVELECRRLVAAEHDALAAMRDLHDRLDLLREVGQLTAGSLDYDAPIGRVANLIVRALADWCVVDLAEEGAPPRRVAVAHAEPGRNLPAKPPDEKPGDAIKSVIEDGRSQLVPEIGADADSVALTSVVGDVGAVSIVSVPLRTRNRSLGALTLVSTRPGRVYDADDVALAEDIARRIATTIERSRLQIEVEDRAEAARVLAHVADGVLLIDRTGVVRLWNAAAEGITGVAAGDVVGRLATTAIPGWKEAVDTVPVFASPDPGHAEVVIPIDTNHGERWIAISGVQFFGGTVYAFRDLTEVRRLEELKADFIATASHELRTPLAAVYGAAQTLLRHDFALDEGGRDRFVSLIADESERLGRIVNEILLANQLEAGRVELEFEPFDAAELVDRVVEATRAYAPPAVTVERVVADSVPRVDADRDKVRQVLVNLVENAIKYSPDGGRVEIRAEPRDDAVLFSVTDEGLGIPAEEQSRVFDKFYRVDPEMARGVGGTGLGLYICNELVTRMGGHIWVESAAGEGSSFLFELPAVTNAVAAVRPERAVRHDGQTSS